MASPDPTEPCPADFVVVFMTAPDADGAARMAGILVDEGLVACVNILPVAIEIDGSSAFEDVYNSIRRELLLNNRHQAYPFLKIAESYSGERDPMRPRLLQAGFTNEPLFNLDLEGLDCSPVYLPREGAQMDLFITWWKRGDSWEGYWEYNTGSFGEDEILRWQDYYARILAVALDDPAAAIGRIELLDGHAARALTGEGSSVDYPLKRSMADLLRESFAAHPAETALVYEGVSVSYAEMEEKVEAVASFICGSAGSGGRVAVILRRSPEMLYALHGIVRSGNAYVPIGIDWPDERVLDILGDIRPVLVLGGEEHRQRIASSGVALHTIEEILSDPARGAGPAAISIDPVDPMYIMYTSGTTGRPKGAVLPHRGIVNRLFWMQDAYRLAPGERAVEGLHDRVRFLADGHGALHIFGLERVQRGKHVGPRLLPPAQHFFARGPVPRHRPLHHRLS